MPLGDLLQEEEGIIEESNGAFDSLWNKGLSVHA